MSQQASITVFDGASTPVSHTLGGESIERKPDGTLTASWKESLSTVPDYAQVRVIMTKRKLPSGIFRVSTRVQVPVMETVTNQNSSGYTAAPKVAYVNTVEVVGLFHERSTVADRRLARMIAINAANNISTTVAAAIAGPVSELFDQLIMAT